ncbi:leucine rich repeat-containing protein [Toxoplasma gondii GAB2-2007-GAL-DOM2]|uniref:Leucine rich repeat-containing protein n=10 Tax=Toxoplasma gondii TaxID=5811 RepID=S7WK09_TOXGG|nr:leucine rich repeat-containing protein [Toxoplasma gondii GT1]KAF4641969.1 leucine rich repeat-containing protein [Toxoplasma gondii]KFG48991.1 leucine rich repeat-containing protein [Toxoplasma gondii GAB2-2007-GAL-DOM2]PUA92481.1 leucine rich repeat-containing protein [Toxoplasma gondii TgCATBr9]RQX75630.1 leucine rich repeat-containing protein [Toxoplasma gondii CAST]
MATGAVLCKQELKKLLRNDRHYYSTPELNDVLFLHFKGYRKLEALEEFTGLRTLHAETNAFGKIEGLDACTGLRSLYLQENCIRKIENLEKLSELQTLNLSSNLIETIENLGHNPLLRTLQLERNYIGRNGRQDFDHLACLKALAVLDLSNNQIEDPAIVFEVLSHLPCLKVLYLKGNPVIRQIQNYRKTVIVTLKELTYLDDRPVFIDERRCAMAFAQGGLQQEREEREKIRKEKELSHEKNRQAFMKLIEEAQRLRREMLDMRAEDREDDDLHNYLENLERNRFNSTQAPLSEDENGRQVEETARALREASAARNAHHLDSIRSRETQLLPELEMLSFATPPTGTPTTDRSHVVPSLGESLPDDSWSIATSQSNSGKDACSDCEQKEESDDVGSNPGRSNSDSSECSGGTEANAAHVDIDTPRERSVRRNELNFDALD